MSHKTYRVKLHLDGDKPRIYRTDGKPTCCCSSEVNYFVWERNTKYNNYNGWHGYLSQRYIQAALKQYNPDNLKV